VRIVRSPAGVVSLDPTGRAPGRGAYLCTDDACWTLGFQKGGLQRALGVTLSPELRARLAADRPAAGFPATTEGGTRGT